MNIELLRKLGGVSQFILVPFRFNGSAAKVKMKSYFLQIGLIMLLLASMLEISLAEPPQNNIGAEDPRAVNGFGEPTASHGPDAPPDGMIGQRHPQPFGQAPIPDNIMPKPNEGSPYRDKPNQEKLNEGDIVIQLFNGRGIASMNNKTNSLLMNVDIIKDVDPAHLRDLMVSNKSIEDIKSELRAAAGNTAARGSLGINEINYPLINIELFPSKDNTTVIDADVAKLHLKPDDTVDNSSIVGHIDVTLATSENGLVGEGKLTMSGDEYNGKYAVHLQMDKTPGGNIPPTLENLIPTI